MYCCGFPGEAYNEVQDICVDVRSDISHDSAIPWAVAILDASTMVSTLTLQCLYWQPMILRLLHQESENDDTYIAQDILDSWLISCNDLKKYSTGRHI